MKLRLLLTVFLSCFLPGVFVLPVLAKLEVHPSLTFEEKYTDNLFLTHDNEVEDWITTIEPGISFSLTNRVADLTLDYSYRLTFYKNNDDLDSSDFEGGQRSTVATTFFKDHPFTLGVSGSISRETLDERENNNEENELVNKSTVYSLSVNPQYRLRLSESTSVVFGYIYDRTDHEDPRGSDYQQHTGRLSLVKQLSTNTEISANYSYMVHQSSDDDEYDQQRYTLGLNQQLGPRTTIALQGGISTIEYENGQNEETINWLVDVSYQLTAPVTLSLRYSQDFANASTEGLTENRDAVFAINYQKESLTANTDVYWSVSDYVLTSRKDESYGTRFSLSFPLSRALSTRFTAGYEKSKYDDVVDEEVDHYNAGTSLDYKFSRFLTSLTYSYRLNDADIDASDYTNNTVTLRVTVRF